MAVPVADLTVETQDAAPTVAPFKASFIRHQLELTLTPTLNGTVRFYQIRIGGNRKTGDKLISRGVVCGMDIPCGAGSSGGVVTAVPVAWDITGSSNISITRSALSFQSGEGDYNVYADLANDDGWAV